MVREFRTPRPDSQQKIESLGLLFHTVDGQPYWNESASYRFSADEISTLESASNTLHELCLEAAEHVISNRLYDRLQIPKKAWAAIEQTWEADPPFLYGRFDLAFNGTDPPKLLEFNADTPTSLLEAAVIQWHWLQEVMPEADQFNFIWEALTAKWKALQAESTLAGTKVHFGCLDSMEDFMTTAVLMDTATEAGLQVELMGMDAITWNHDDRQFITPAGERIQTKFKLYPWEWMNSDPFGGYALESVTNMHWIEPVWKMVLSNKAILAILWELFPDHPNLLPAYLDGPRDLADFVKKPILGREGANVTVQRGQDSLSTEGTYGKEGFVWQSYVELPAFEGNHMVIGSWIVDCEACAIGIRESDSLVTDDLARFVPHYFLRDSQE